MFKTISKYAWFSFVPFLAMSLLTIDMLIAGQIHPAYLIGTFVMWCLVSGLGIAVGYHRVFSHKTHSLPAWKENIIMFFAALGGQGSSITWTAIHRGYHHRFSDKEGDLHSPVVHGRWHAFFGWTLNITEDSNIINMRYAVDLLRKPNHLWFHKWHFHIQWGVPLIVALFDWHAALCWFCLPTGMSLLQDNLINVFGHEKAFLGYRNYDTDDNSHNNMLLGYLAWGQGWHNNHHQHPAAYDFGTGTSGKWWEYDPCRIFLPFLGEPNERE